MYSEIDTLEIGEEKMFKTGVKVERTMKDEAVITVEGEEFIIHDSKFEKIANAMGYIIRDKSDVDAW